MNCCPQFISLSGSWSRTAPGGPDGKGAEAPDDILRQNPKSSEESEVQNTAIACDCQWRGGGEAVFPSVWVCRHTYARVTTRVPSVQPLAPKITVRSGSTLSRLPET